MHDKINQYATAPVGGPEPPLALRRLKEIEAQQHQLSASLLGLRRALTLVSRDGLPKGGAENPPMPTVTSPLVGELDAIIARNRDLLRLLDTIRDETSEVAE